MSDWGGGYVTETEYLPGYYREQAPAHMALACLLNGVAPPALGPDFAYCDLGCGPGRTVALLAAANPQARFHGVDFHPAHIARGRETADQAGLGNLHFHEASFADLADGDGADALPDFDVVALHGVYTWVSEENRAAVVRFLARKVKPGGMVYIGYNAAPGWTPVMPLQRLLLEHAGQTPGNPEERVVAALDFARRLRGAGAGILGDVDSLVGFRNGVAVVSEQEHYNYLSHEYLNAHWRPLYHQDVARDMARAKLTYAGSATLLENFPDLTLSPQQRELLAEIKDPALRETFKDYCANRPFRRDVFVRGARRLTAAERDRRLSSGLLHAAVSREECSHVIKAPAGEAAVDKARYGAIFDALARGPRSVGDLQQAAASADSPAAPPSPAEIAGLLTGSRQTFFCDGAATTLNAPMEAAALRFNRQAAAAAAESLQHKMTSFAAPACGSGVHVSLVETLLYDALVHGAAENAEAVTAWALERMAAAGGPPATENPNRAALQDSLGWCLANSLPLWRRLGISD